MSYWRFGAMIVTSTAAMFGLMYLNTYALEHLFFSETRLYMALLMGATMAVVMLSFMLSMYADRKVNTAILAGSIVLFAVSLWLVRSQATVQDQSFMRAMIPHHSIAIMTSQRAELTDARVQKLAREIVLAQNREISEMRYLIADIDRGGDVVETYEDPPLQRGTLEQALDVTRIATLDPAPLKRDDLPPDASSEALECGFRRVHGEEPILWSSAASAVMNLNGVIIPLERKESSAGRLYAASGVAMEVRELDEPGLRANAELVFTLDRGLRVGYRGFYDCGLG